jgi:hypothetical protein
MNRRGFLSLGLSTPAFLGAQQAAARPERVESMRPAATPAIALNHLGFLPKGRKTVIVRAAGDFAPTEYTIRDIGSSKVPFRVTRPLKTYQSDVIACMAGDFSDIEREGMY